MNKIELFDVWLSIFLKVGLLVKHYIHHVKEPFIKWVECIGIPVKGWTGKTFLSIAKEWGKLMFSNFGNCLQSDLEKAYIMLWTHESVLKECTRKLRIGNEKYLISIKELCSEDALQVFEELPEWEDQIFSPDNSPIRSSVTKDVVG